MNEGRPPKIDFQNNRFASAVRDSARYASARDRVLEKHISQRPEISAQMERLQSQGLDPTAWLHVISIPWLFRINEQTSSGRILAEVFKQCELDHRNPRHWRILLDALVEQCFRGPGAPQKWDEGGLVEILADIRAVRARYPEVKSNIEVAKFLRSKDPFKKKYKRFDNDRLRKIVGRAIDPKFNPAAEVAEGEDWLKFRAERAARELGLPTEVGVEAQMANLEQLVLDNMRKFYFERREAEPAAIVEADWQQLLPELREFAKSEAERIRNT